MKFESSFLVRVIQLTHSDWICLCPTISLKAFGSTKQEAIESMRANLENYVNTWGAHYINSIGKSPDGVCCPEGFLDLPLDLWKCKLDRQVCKLQAWIPIGDKELFVTNCHAPGQRKEDIYRIVVEEIYKGAHHKPGRYLCPTCGGKSNTRYHYSWELTSLSDFVDISDHDFRVALIENDISMSVVSSNLCPDCFMRVISIVKPDLVGEFESLQLSFTNEPFQSGEPENLHLKDEKSRRDFVASCLESPGNSWNLGLALASLYGQEEYAPDFGDALDLAGDWLGLTDDEVTAICNDEDESKCEKLYETAISVAWRAGWVLLCGGLDELLNKGWKSSS